MGLSPTKGSSGTELAVYTERKGSHKLRAYLSGSAMNLGGLKPDEQEYNLH